MSRRQSLYQRLRKRDKSLKYDYYSHAIVYFVFLGEKSAFDVWFFLCERNDFHGWIRFDDDDGKSKTASKKKDDGKCVFFGFGAVVAIILLLLDAVYSEDLLARNIFMLLMQFDSAIGHKRNVRCEANDVSL